MQVSCSGLAIGYVPTKLSMSTLLPERKGGEIRCFHQASPSLSCESGSSKKLTRAGFGALLYVPDICSEVSTATFPILMIF